MSQRIITVCGDPGGAAAIAPVIQYLQKFNDVKNFSYLSGQNILKSKGIAYNPIPERASLNWISAQLQDCRCILTATSVNSLEWEKRFIQLGRERGIPSVSVLDFWSSYGVRFTDESNEMSFLPDKLAVMDARAANAMTQLGVSSNRLVVTGQPAFSEILNQKKTFKNMRLAHQLQSNELFIIFASQPLQQFCGDYYGFTEKSVIPEVINSIEMALELVPQKIVLALIPHPRENSEEYQSFESEMFEITSGTKGRGVDYVLSADLVIGMNSVILLESCYLGQPTVSLQPGLVRTDSLPSNDWGASAVTYKKEDIASLLLPLINQREQRERLKNFAISKCIPPPTDAAEKIANELISLMEKS